MIGGYLYECSNLFSVIHRPFAAQWVQTHVDPYLCVTAADASPRDNILHITNDSYTKSNVPLDTANNIMHYACVNKMKYF